ncbi:hypothetical protein J6590_060817 [Homalodisca vitripennis]|nr:hypothetical protein J6590_060817 [Homalodisca vitripennis]
MLAFKECKRAARRFRKVNPFDIDLILISPTPSDRYRTLGPYRCSHARQTDLESLGGTYVSAMERVLHDLGRYLEWYPQSWLLYDTSSCPRQQNDVDCGVFPT